jgi:hypothetical protein
MAELTDAQARAAELEQLEIIKERERREADQALEAVQRAVQSGDVDALRAAFEGPNGVVLGRLALHGCLERMMLLEMMKAPKAPLELLRVFFRDLRGRYCWDTENGDGVHVYSLLIDIDVVSANLHTASESDAVCWMERMAEIVGYIANDLRQPVLRWAVFSRSSRSMYSVGTLIQLSWHNDAWASWAAFAKHVPVLEGQTAYRMLYKMAVWEPKHSTPYFDFWFRRSVSDLTDDELQTLVSRQERAGTRKEFAFRPLMNAEVERRSTTRTWVRLLFVAQNYFKKDPKMPKEIMEEIIAISRSDLRF